MTGWVLYSCKKLFNNPINQTVKWFTAVLEENLTQQVSQGENVKDLYSFGHNTQRTDSIKQSATTRRKAAMILASY